MKIGIIGAGTLGMTLGYRLAQAGQDVTIVLRLAREGATETTDYIDSVDMRCAEPGPARAGAQAPWPATWPEPQTLDGTTITVDTVFTDVHEASAEIGVELVLDAGG